MRWVSLALALLLATPALADDLPAAAFAPHLDGVLRDPTLTTLYGQCPADIFGLAATGAPTVVESGAACRADLGRCLAACRGGADVDACTYAARAFEAASEEIGEEAGRRLYALACAVGSASGCTNRGAGVRNNPIDSDPLVALPLPVQEDCTARTFAAACDAGDPWGCAMTGQALALGEGVSRSSREALAAYDDACALSSDPEFAACAFARAQRRDLTTITQSP